MNLHCFAHICHFTCGPL